MNIVIIAALACVLWSLGRELNVFIFTLAVMFLIHQNHYFGWNKEPASDAELIADGITFLLFALAFLGNSVTVSINQRG